MLNACKILISLSSRLCANWLSCYLAQPANSFSVM